MSIPDELENTRRMAFAADEAGARDLLFSLIPRIERDDRDDLMLEALAQLGETYLARGAYDGVRESVRRIEDCLAIYAGIAAGTMPREAEQLRSSGTEIAHMMCRYSRRAQFLQTGLAAALGDHEGAAVKLASLCDNRSDVEDASLTEEHRYLCTYAQVLCATALCDDDLHVLSVPLWENVFDGLGSAGGSGDRADYLWIAAATGYGRFCVETGRLSEAEPWLRRAEARAAATGWELAEATAQLERAAARWAANDHAGTEQLVGRAYPVIARHDRAHDVARCWLYMGLTRLGACALEAADGCWEHAERHWRELGKPLHLHRILLQRSWIAIFWSRFSDAHLRCRREHGRLERRGQRLHGRRDCADCRRRAGPGNGHRGAAAVRDCRGHRRHGPERARHHPAERPAGGRADGVGGLRPRLVGDIGGRRR